MGVGVLDPEPASDELGELVALPESLGVGLSLGVLLVDGVTVTVTVGLALDGSVELTPLLDVDGVAVGAGVRFVDSVPPNKLGPEP